jgi:hypothetical protein
MNEKMITKTVIPILHSSSMQYQYHKVVFIRELPKSVDILYKIQIPENAIFLLVFPEKNNSEIRTLKYFFGL